MLNAGNIVNSYKPTDFLPSSRKIRFGAVPALLGLAFIWPFGHRDAQHVTMMAGKQAPAAHGTVSVKETKSGNTQLSLKTWALAQPTALTPPEQNYVVWIQPRGHQAKDAGKLTVDPNLHGKFQTTTPYKDFTVFVTAEKQAIPHAPSGPRVLSAHVRG